MVLAACSNQAVYTGESFASDSPFKMRSASEVAPACESARRALLGQGYLIESANEEGIKARKATRDEDSQNTFIEMTVVCLPDPKGSSLFATAVLSRYSLKKSSSAASVGVSALGSISLPIGQSADSLVKVSEETIDDKDFYGRFFAAVSNILEEMEAGKIPVEVAAEPVPDPAPEPPAAAAPQPVAVPAPPAAPAASPAESPSELTPSTTVAAPGETGTPPVVATPPSTGVGTTPSLSSTDSAIEDAAAMTLDSFETSEQPPTYTLQPGDGMAAPTVSPQPAPDAETPVNTLEAGSGEPLPAAPPEPALDDDHSSAPQPAPVAPEPEAAENSDLLLF